MKKIAWFLLISVLFVSVYAAETMPCVHGYCFDCYDSSRGLPQNQIVAFAKNRDGYMFVAGRNFIARFDGDRFVFPGSGKLEGIPTNTINDFVIDGIGTAYVATDLGLWTGNTSAFERLSFKNAEKVGNLEVSSLAYNEKKALVFGAVSGKGAFSFSATGAVEWFSPENSRLGTKNVNKVFVDSLGTVWLGTDSGVYFMKDGIDRFVQIDYLDDPVSAFAEEAENRIYAGGRNGYYLIENGEVSISYAGEKVPWSDITAFINDDSGRFWIGTKNSGLLFDENHVLNVDGAITSFTRDNEGEFWFGTSTHGFCIAKISAFVDTIFRDASVSGVVADASGNIFFNSDKGIFKREPNDICDLDDCRELIVQLPQIFDRIFIDKNDNLWASSKLSGLFIMQPDRTFKPVKEIYTSEDDLFPASSDIFFSDADGNVWVNDLSMRGALFVFRNDKTAERFMLPGTDAEIVDIIEHNGKFFAVTKRNGVFGLEDNGSFASVALWTNEIFVKRVFVDSKQRIWIVTLSDEIYIDIEKDAIAFPITGITGKAAIHSVSEDGKGNIWFMTNAGVAVAKGEDADCFVSGKCTDLPMIVYGRKDGMSSVECAEGTAAGAVVSADGYLFVPMMKGVAVFDTNFREPGGFVPEIRIERIFSSDKDREYYPDDNGKIVLPHSLKNLSVSYSAPLFSGAGELLFDYSFDREQVKGSDARTITLTSLQRGMHEFSIRAYRSGNPSEYSEKKLLIKVNPAFYEKKGVVVTLPFLVVFLLAVIIFLNRRLKVIRDGEIKRLIDEKTAELQMQNNTLKEAVMKDPLTGLMNRRYMFEVEERKIRRFIESRDRKIHLMDNRNMLEKNDLVYGAIMMDIDHFKRVNDLYGHDTGDMVLKGVAQIMQDSVRADDILIRWGGEEFLIVLKNIPVKKMFEVAKKIRKAIEMHPFAAQNGSTIWVTVSMGVVFLPFFASEPKLLTFENTITLADMALYYSKNNGRDMATFVVPGKNMPVTQDDISGMLGSSEFAAVNGFYTFEKIEPDNFSEFVI